MRMEDWWPPAQLRDRSVRVWALGLGGRSGRPTPRPHDWHLFGQFGVEPLPSLEALLPWLPRQLTRGSLLTTAHRAAVFRGPIHSQPGARETLNGSGRWSRFRWRVTGESA